MKTRSARLKPPPRLSAKAATGTRVKNPPARVAQHSVMLPTPILLICQVIGRAHTSIAYFFLQNIQKFLACCCTV